MTVAETLKEKVETLASSAGALGKLTVDKIEEASNLNIASLTYYSDVCVRQLRLFGNLKVSNIRISDIGGVGSIQNLAADSISISGDLTKRALEDGKAWLNLGMDYTKKVSALLGGGALSGEELKGEGIVDNEGAGGGKKSAAKSVTA